MKQTNYLKLAESIAIDAHEGQFRRDNKTPYINHVESVVSSLKDESDDVKIVAWLHDVIEDSEITEQFLLNAGISERLVNCVSVLDKNKYNSYLSYIEEVAKNEIARKVKIADIKHNISDDPTDRQKKKYLKALAILEN